MSAVRVHLTGNQGYQHGRSYLRSLLLPISRCPYRAPHAIIYVDAVSDNTQQKRRVSAARALQNTNDLLGVQRLPSLVHHHTVQVHAISKRVKQKQNELSTSPHVHDEVGTYIVPTWHLDPPAVHDRETKLSLFATDITSIEVKSASPSTSLFLMTFRAN
jgi:hypothetical protein